LVSYLEEEVGASSSFLEEGLPFRVVVASYQVEPSQEEPSPVEPFLVEGASYPAEPYQAESYPVAVEAEVLPSYYCLALVPFLVVGAYQEVMSYQEVAEAVEPCQEEASFLADIDVDYYCIAAALPAREVVGRRRPLS